MGTRGAYGFQKDGIRKLTYNHFDSYPTCLGNEIVDFIRSSDIEEMNAIFDRIQLVDEHDKPTPEMIAVAKELELINLNVSNQTTDDLYCIFRNAQGDLSVYKYPQFIWMTDGTNFIKDDAWCEWGYIINLDTNMLEVYTFGENKIREYPLTPEMADWNAEQLESEG